MSGKLLSMDGRSPRLPLGLSSKGICPEYARLLKAVCTALDVHNKTVTDLADIAGTGDHARFVSAQQITQSAMAEVLIHWIALKEHVEEHDC
jgi:hypothetical protein